MWLKILCAVGLVITLITCLFLYSFLAFSPWSLCLPLWESLPLFYSQVYLISYLIKQSLKSPSLPPCMLGCFSHVQLFVTSWTVTHLAPLSMGFSRQEHWSGLPCPLPRALPDPGIKPSSLMSPALAGRFFTTSAIWEALFAAETLQFGQFALQVPAPESLSIFPVFDYFPNLTSCSFWSYSLGLLKPDP